MSFSRLLGTTAVLGLLGAPAAAATIYAQTFSTDPGWTTSQTQNFYWDALAGAYVAQTYDAGTTGISQFAGTTVNLDTSRSFSLSWDQKIVSVSSNTPMFFGLTTGSSSPSDLGAGYSSAGPFTTYDISIQGAAGTDNGVGGIANEYSIYDWHNIRMDYDQSNQSLSYTLTNLNTGTQTLQTTFSVGSSFLSEMTYLGVGNNSNGLGQATPTGFTGTPTQVTQIDNIYVTGEYLTPPPPTGTPNFAFPLAGLDQIYTNTVAGGNSAIYDSANGFNDPYHFDGGAYYSVDFDLNGISDSADVLAASGGTVVALSGSSNTGACGTEPVCVIIDHGNGYFTQYREFSSLANLSLNMVVQEGDILGTLVAGATRPNGLFADHLHFQIMYDVNGNGIPDSSTRAPAGSALTYIPYTGESYLGISQLQGVTVGGLQLTGFSLGSSGNGHQGLVGFIQSSGDISANPDGVLDYTTTSPLSVGQTSPGELIVNGPISLGVQNTLSVGLSAPGAMYIVNGGSVTADSVTVGPNGSLNLNNGYITALNSGVTMGGIMTIGASPGAGTIYGDFTMSGGFWNVEIAGTSQGLFDVLNIFGDASFVGGTIGISFLNGFIPSVGDTFDFLNVSGATTFGGTQVSVAGLPSNLGLSFIPSAGGGLTAVTLANSPAPVPLPSSFAQVFSSLILLLGISTIRRRRMSREMAGAPV